MLPDVLNRGVNRAVFHNVTGRRLNIGFYVREFVVSQLVPLVYFSAHGTFDLSKTINSSEHDTVMIAYARVRGHFMNKGGPVSKEKFEGINSSCGKVDNLCEVELAQEVKKRLVNFKRVPVAADDLICPINVGEIEISTAPESTTWV